jgi:hypothetical protein
MSLRAFDGIFCTKLNYIRSMACCTVISNNMLFRICIIREQAKPWVSYLFISYLLREDM